MPKKIVNKNDYKLDNPNLLVHKSVKYCTTYNEDIEDDGSITPLYIIKRNNYWVYQSSFDGIEYIVEFKLELDKKKKIKNREKINLITRTFK